MTYRKKLIMRKHRAQAKKLEEKEKQAKAQGTQPRPGTNQPARPR